MDEHRELINRLNSLYFRAYNCYGKAIDEAIEMIRDEGIRDYTLTREILNASHYGQDARQT